jgi:hypothetical protein
MYSTVAPHAVRSSSQGSRFSGFPSQQWKWRLARAGLVAVALQLPALAFAKISAKPGDDGAPPDPQAEADAAALNEALEGPDEGQTQQQWLAELDRAHQAVYGTSIFTSFEDTTNEALDCSLVDESDSTVGCDGNPTWLHISEPYDVVLSRVTHCPYDSYIECLQAGQTVTYCKTHQLNCHEGEPTDATATIDFDARQCTDEPLCLCAEAEGDVSVSGYTVQTAGEICFFVEDFTYSGPWDNQVEAEIEAMLDDNGWQLCLPAECVEG